MTEHLRDDQVQALRAHTVSAVEGFALLEHAAECRECSRLLITPEQMHWEVAGLQGVISGNSAHLTVEEINDVADGQVASEDALRIAAHIEACEACSRDLQQVRQLTTEFEHNTDRGSRRTWREWFEVPTYRLSLATALVLIVATLAVWIGSRGGNRPAPSRPVDVASGTRRTDAANFDQNQKSGQPQPGAAPEPKKRVGEVRSTLAIVLAPGIMRGGSQAEPSVQANEPDQQRNIRVPAGVEVIAAKLESRSGWDAGTYASQLTRDGEGVIWQNRRLYKTAPNSFILEIPARLLRPGTYLITISAFDDGKQEHLNDYPFRVVQ